MQEPTFNLTTPDGYHLSIREWDGEDEYHFSRQGDIESGDNINKFLSRIIVDNDMDFRDEEGNKKEKLTAQDVAKLKTSTKYYALLQARIFTLGSDIEFNYTFEGDEESVPLVDNLSSLERDFSKWFDSEGNPLFDKNQVYELSSKDYKPKPYPEGKNSEHYLNLSTGKEVYWQNLTGVGEKMFIQMSREDLGSKHELMARFLMLKYETSYIPVEDFSVFKPRELKEIKDEIRKKDPQFYGIIKVENPQPKINQDKYELSPVFQLDGFFLT